MVADLICSLTVVDTAVAVVDTAVVVVVATAVEEVVTAVEEVATAEVVAAMVITTLQAAATAATEACLDDDLSIVGADHTDENSQVVAVVVTEWASLATASALSTGTDKPSPSSRRSE
jgi:hypothetical protein